MRTIEFGQIQIDRIMEMERWAFSASNLFPSINPELLKAGRDWLDDRFIDLQNDNLILSVHSFLIRYNGQAILVDTCNGNHKNRPSLPSRHNLNTNYLANLRKTGVRPEDVTLVLCTHLHPDHCGWNTYFSGDRWLPTFPNAKYLVNKLELECLIKMYANWQSQSAVNDMVLMFEDSIQPIIHTKQLGLINDGHVVLQRSNNKIWLESSAGHTPGHAFVHVKCKHNHVVITGDAIHHPIQLDALDLANASDLDPKLAANTRLRLIESYTDTNTIILTGHFAGHTAGRIVSKKNKFRFQWLET